MYTSDVQGKFYSTYSVSNKISILQVRPIIILLIIQKFSMKSKDGSNEESFTVEAFVSDQFMNKKNIFT